MKPLEPRTIGRRASRWASRGKTQISDIELDFRGPGGKSGPLGRFTERGSCSGLRQLDIGLHDDAVEPYSQAALATFLPSS